MSGLQANGKGKPSSCTLDLAFSKAEIPYSRPKTLLVKRQKTENWCGGCADCCRAHDDYYMYWLENDLVLHLNNNISTNNGVSIELKKEHSFITTEFLQKKIPIHDLSSRIFKLWCLFNLDKQVQFIRIQCNDIYHL